MYGRAPSLPVTDEDHYNPKELMDAVTKATRNQRSSTSRHPKEATHPPPSIFGHGDEASQGLSSRGPLTDSRTPPQTKPPEGERKSMHDSSEQNSLFNSFFNSLDHDLKVVLQNDYKEILIFSDQQEKEYPLPNAEKPFKLFLEKSFSKASNDVSRMVDQLEDYLFNLVNPQGIDRKDINLDDYLRANREAPVEVKPSHSPRKQLQKIRADFSAELGNLQQTRAERLVRMFEKHVQAKNRLIFEALRSKLRKEQPASLPEKLKQDCIRDVIQLQIDNNNQNSDFIFQMQYALDNVKLRIKKL